MKALPWFRMYHEALDDEKLGLLAFEDRWHFVALLCLKCRGVLDSEPDFEMLQRKVSLKMGLAIRELDEVIDKLASVGLVDSKTLQPVMHLVATELRPLSHIWREIRERIFARDDYTCQYCGERGKKLECDHIHPVSKGGSNQDDNLATACFACNRSKRDKTLNEWRLA